MFGGVVGGGGGEKVGVRIIKHWIKKAQATKVKIKIPASIRCVGDFPHPSVALVISRIHPLRRWFPAAAHLNVAFGQTSQLFESVEANFPTLQYSQTLWPVWSFT